MSTSHIITVSNRLPVSVVKRDGKLEFESSSGGLATALNSIDSQKTSMLWIGWPGIADEELTPEDKAQIIAELAKSNCYPVFLTQAQVDDFYFGYSNETIWPLFHYFPQNAVYESKYWNAYKKVNQLFGDAVLKHVSANTTIWIHDYHFMLLPRILRSKAPDSAIGFFLHIPFPSYELFRQLPESKAILEGLLGADLVGFHTYDYARHFMSSVLRSLGYEATLGTIHVRDRIVHADAFPISIDYRKFADKVSDEDTQAEIERLKEHHNGQRMIVSLDRVDYSKGILKRLEGFDLFLEENPGYHGKVVMMMVAIPSRTEVEAYKNLRDQIELSVSRINGKYATVDWTPITYQYHQIPFEQLVALYSHSDIGLVTPLRDGMNLVAKEYVASHQAGRGVLILSEMTGAASEFPEAMHINPNSREAIAEAIKEALEMPLQERKTRLKAMQRRLAKYTVQRWIHDLIEQLDVVKQRQAERSSRKLQKVDREAIIEQYRSAGSRLLLLDYDGTLVNFTNTPAAAKAKPSRALLKTLSKLHTPKYDEVVIISGRPKAALDSWFKTEPITLVAEHGGWIREGTRWRKNDTDFTAWKERLRPILEHYEERTPGAKVEEKDFALVWHYKNVPAEQAFVRNNSLKQDIYHELNDDESEIGVFDGNKIIEIKPRTVHKGVTAEEWHYRRDWDFVLCMGDDYTDEDMFKALPESAVTIKVGFKDSAAKFYVGTVEEAVKLLEDLAAVQ